ncbi:MAG: FAD-dependent oxidoreductase [Lentisphaerae bacterium]|nr:FAD-dependent oxidoreductase [Lentisphaerota bacterium]
MNGIPLIGSYDIVVVGGASGGVAAAAAAARAGVRVLLVAAENYLGEDICATGQLWLDPDVPLSTPLARDIFQDDTGARRVPVGLLDVKRRLDAELLDAGVRVLFGCAPADLLVDAADRVAGVVLTSRTGLFAVTARVLVDATPLASLARAAGLSFSAWSGGAITVQRVVAGRRADGDDGTVGRPLPGRIAGMHYGRLAEAEAFAYTAELPLPAWTPAALAAAETTMRDRTGHQDQTWASDRLWFVPPVSIQTTAPPLAWPAAASLPLEAFATPRAHLFVLGPCAAVPREAAAHLLVAPHAMEAGQRLGTHVAACAQRLPAVRTPRPLHPAASDNALREPCTCARFKNEQIATLGGRAGADLPVLGEFDVVVVGGGTGGAPAAIAAARAGARVLVIEPLHGLGGVGTLGCISVYYHGYRGGFTGEITEALRKMAGDAPFSPDRWNNDHKAEWLRREIGRCGGAIWFGCFVSGAVVRDRLVCGVIVNTPWGRGLVRASAVVDATGNSDVAAAAGATCRVASDDDLAVQGTGLPARPFRPVYQNTDYTFVEDGDPVDVTRAFIVARRKFADGFDIVPLVDSRERRQIVGDVTVTPLDVFTGRKWRDTIALTRSDFDSHGFTVHPIFFVQPPDRAVHDAWLPLRALLPRGLDGILVTGLGLSAQRDVMPVLRMQADTQNHAYAAGVAAAMAARAGDGNIRALDIKLLQRQLAQKGIIPQQALLHREDGTLPAAVVRAAVSGDLLAHAELAAALRRPAVAIPALRARLAAEPDADMRVRCAKLLAALGDNAGESVLIERVRQCEWDEGWNFTGMGQYGRSLSPLDECIVCLALLRSRAACAGVLDKAAALDAGQAFSHFRAVSVYAETVRDPAFVPVLTDVLAKPGIGGHAWTKLADELADIPAGAADTRTRNDALRELYLARALVRGGDPDGAGTRVLEAYRQDLRGHFARHAAGVLATRSGQ